MTPSTPSETADLAGVATHVKMPIQHSVHQLVRQAVFARAAEPLESLIAGTVMGFHGVFTRSHSPGQEPELWTSVALASLLPFLLHEAGGQQANVTLQESIVPLSGFSVELAPEFCHVNEDGVLGLAAGFDMSRALAGPALPESITPLEMMVDDIMARADKAGALRIGWTLLIRVPKPESPKEELEMANQMVAREVVKFAEWLSSQTDEQVRHSAEQRLYVDFISSYTSGRERKAMRSEPRLRPSLAANCMHALRAGFGLSSGLFTEAEKSEMLAKLQALKTAEELERV